MTWKYLLDNEVGRNENKYKQGIFKPSTICRWHFTYIKIIGWNINDPNKECLQVSLTFRKNDKGEELKDVQEFIKLGQVIKLKEEP